MNDKCLGHQKIAAATLAAASSPTIPAGTREMWVQCAAANVRYTLDGTTPTALIGMILVAGAHQPQKFTLAHSLRNIQFILETGTPDVYITYFGQSDT